MDEEVRRRFNEHVAELRAIADLRPGNVGVADATERLQAFWLRSCEIARVASTAPDREREHVADTLIRLSRETVAQKKREFGLADPLIDDSCDLYENDSFGWGGDGGAAVPAGIHPKPPPRWSADAKAFPPEDEMRDP